MGLQNFAYMLLCFPHLFVKCFRFLLNCEMLSEMLSVVNVTPLTSHLSCIGMTTTTLSLRLTMHLASGGPKQHALTNHHMPLTREELVNNTKIIFRESNNNKLYH